MWQRSLDIAGGTYMNRIQQAFHQKKAFIGFITGGDPDIETSEALLKNMCEAGCDLIEIGIPFSDPIAEGPIIQAADLRALASHTRVDDLFAMVQRFRQANQTTPVVFMSYLNPIFHYGYDAFFQQCQMHGIDGVIVPDLPYEEQWELRAIAQQYDIATISMIAPTSKARIQEIAQHADPNGFLYVVSSMGVTGVRSSIQTDLAQMMEEVRKVSDIPAAIGFGISTPEQAKEMAQIADGVIVGSAIVSLVGAHGKTSLAIVKDYVKSMKDAL